MASEVIIDKSKCSGCMLCSQVCLLNNFSKADDGKACVDSRSCIRCGHCFAVCPAGAITVDGISPADDDGNTSLSYDGLMALLRHRRSRREFTDQKIPQEIIAKLIQAASQAPNALNKQLVHYTVITDTSIISSLSAQAVAAICRLAKIFRNPAVKALLRVFNRAMHDELSELLPEVDQISQSYAAGCDRVLYNAPCVIMIHTPKSDTSGAENAVYCAANILLAADTLGIGACVIGFITQPSKYNPAFKRLAQIPQNHNIHTTIALGYPRFEYPRCLQKAKPNIHYVLEQGQ